MKLDDVSRAADLVQDLGAADGEIARVRAITVVRVEGGPTNCNKLYSVGLDQEEKVKVLDLLVNIMVLRRARLVSELNKLGVEIPDTENTNAATS